jgi:hypothetical protein
MRKFLAKSKEEVFVARCCSKMVDIKDDLALNCDVHGPVTEREKTYGKNERNTSLHKRYKNKGGRCL